MNHPDTVNDHYATSLGNIDNKVLAVGGYLSSTTGNNKVELFDTDTNQWTTKTSFPFCSSRFAQIIPICFVQVLSDKNIRFRIYRFAVISRDSSVFIIGGGCDSSHTSRIAKYTLDAWTEVGNLQTTRYGPRAIQNGDRIYVVGGIGTQP